MGNTGLPLMSRIDVTEDEWAQVRAAAALARKRVPEYLAELIRDHLRRQKEEK